MVETVVMKSGMVKVSSFGYKVKKVLWGILGSKGVPAQNIVRAKGEINSELFEIFNMLGFNKDDAVYIELPLIIEDDKTVKPKWNEIKITRYVKDKEFTFDDIEEKLRG